MTPQVKRYLDVFGRDRVHFALLEDLAARPLETYRSVLEFLQVDPEFVPREMTVVNANNVRRVPALQRVRTRLRGIESGMRRVLPAPVFRAVTAPLKFVWDANTRQKPRDPMPPALEAELTSYFAPDVASLSELIGRDLTAAWPRFREPVAAA